MRDGRGRAAARSDAALVVASHGDRRGARRSLARAARRASATSGSWRARTRGAAVLEALDVHDALREPGAHARRARHRRAHAGRDRDLDPGRDRRRADDRTRRWPESAIDPVCGMEVVASDATPSTSTSTASASTSAARAAARRSPADASADRERHRARARRRRLARLGQPKQLLPYGGATLLDHTLATARACAFDQLRLRARRRLPTASASAVDLERRRGRREPRSSATGCSSSIAAALGGVDPRCDVLVLLLGDQPGVTPATVAALLDGRGDATLAACRYDDGRGHPLAFSRAVFGDLAVAARRQGRVEAARPRAARSSRSRSRARSRSTSTPGTTTKRCADRNPAACSGRIGSRHEIREHLRGRGPHRRGLRDVARRRACRPVSKRPRRWRATGANETC